MSDALPPVAPSPKAPAGPSSQEPSLSQRITTSTSRLTWIAAATLLIALVMWVSFTPDGILGKADAVGYAVCHRITVRSFAYTDEGRQLPMCARCTGTFIGVLIGLLGPGLLFRRRHAGMWPSMPIMVVMIALSAFWAFDGANSFTFLIPSDKIPHLYQPGNFLRLLTGTAHGITMGSMILPIANASLWADVTTKRTLNSFWEYLALLGIGAVMMAMILSEQPIFMYPLGLISAVGAMSILSVVNTVLMATILRQENQARSLREALPLIMFGFAMTTSLIGMIDAMRFAMFGTWDGFVF
jgi:uncharacterized membrane protein